MVLRVSYDAFWFRNTKIMNITWEALLEPAYGMNVIVATTVAVAVFMQQPPHMLLRKLAKHLCSPCACHCLTNACTPMAKQIGR